MASSSAFKLYKLATDSEVSIEDDGESICSNQNCETDLVEDTPDTDTKSECSDYTRVEFEIASSDEEVPAGQSLSSGSDENLITAGTIAAVLCDSSLGAWMMDGDESDGSYVESEVKPIDFWTCVQCKNRNNNPLYRFCQECFQERKQSLPPRPRKRKRGKTLTTNKIGSSSQDSGIVSLTDCRESIKSPEPDIKRKVKIRRITSSSIDLSDASDKNSAISTNQVGFKRKNSSNDTEIPFENKKAKLEEVIDNKNHLPELCLCCNKATKDGVFVHGKTAHMCFCYKCCLRTWKSSKRCPICNRTVSNVIKVFTS